VLVWSNFDFADAAGLGDRLASYVDQGGGVVVACFASSSATAERFLAGRWLTHEYDIIPSAGGTKTGPATLGTVLQPGHPLIQGVGSFSGGSSSFRPTTTAVLPPSTVVVEWDDGSTLVAVREDAVGGRVDLGFYPPSDVVLPNFWDATTDGGVLLANAVWYVAQRPPLAPGDSDGDADVDADDFTKFEGCFTGPDEGPVLAGCVTFDFDRDDDIDCWDWLELTRAWTGLDEPPDFAPCARFIPTMSTWGLTSLALLVLAAGTLAIRGRMLGITPASRGI
jgi:hypothetical protein